jgi:DMSO/TMAO reductase YedYZ molybdopterin-dependent catalytic subunit
MSDILTAAIVDHEVLTRQARDAGLILQQANPLNAEAPMSALNGAEITPNAQFYVRNHFSVPALDAADWQLTVTGSVEHLLAFRLHDLYAMRSVTQVVTLECAGNNRVAFQGQAPGEQWRLGAVSTAEWTGVPLVEILDRAKPTPGAREVLFRGADCGPVDGQSRTVSFERSLRLDDIADSNALLAYQMNGAPLPSQHGYPLRLIVPGWYGVASVKWLTEIDVIDHAFDGYFQTERYRYVGLPGGPPVRHQRVRALITEPVAGQVINRGEMTIRGLAWSGFAPIAGVRVRVGERRWHDAHLVGPPQPHGWRRWELHTRLNQPGNTTVRARAIDTSGRSQPDHPRWNALGYGANPAHTVPIQIAKPGRGERRRRGKQMGDSDLSSDAGIGPRPRRG